MYKVWFTSDTHFGSKRTLELSKRPFNTVEEMDEVLIENWNSMIDDFDIVYHLGDFGDYEKAKELKGVITLIKGNYEKNDNDFNKYKDYFYRVIDDKYTFWFEHITNNCLHGYKVNMAHEPSLVKNEELTLNHVNIFGHIHKLCMIKPYGLNVGVDCHNFKPIDLETVLFYHKAILNNYDKEVFN